jgi:hypothetical protein
LTDGTFRVIEVPGGPLGNWGHLAYRWAGENLDDLGEWTYFVGDDDILLQKALEFFSQNFGENEIVIGRAVSLDRNTYRFNYLLGNEIKVNLITGSCSIYKTAVLKEVGYGDSSYAADWTLINKFVQRGKVAHIKSVVYVLIGPLDG